MVSGGVDEDNITLEDAVAGYEALGEEGLLALQGGDWDAGMVDHVSVGGGAWEAERGGGGVVQQEERVMASRLLTELQRARRVGVGMLWFGGCCA